MTTVAGSSGPGRSYAAMVHISPEDIADVSVADLVASASRSPMLDEREEEALADRWASGHDAARDALVRAHLRLAVDEAIRNRGLGARQDRLARLAARALVEAAPEYDPKAHGAFSRWARITVRNAIKAALVS